MVSATRKVAVETPVILIVRVAFYSPQVSKNCYNIDLLKKDADSEAPFHFLL